MAQKEPSQVRIKELFSYKNGSLVRKKLSSGMSNTESVGDIVGGEDNLGYLVSAVDMRTCKVSRLVWIWHHGSIDGLEIDHINGIRSDNRIRNLRAVTKQENLKNKRKYENNRSGVTGVSWYKSKNKWIAKISCGNKSFSLGYHSDFFEAVCARKSAERKHGFHYNHGF